MTRINCVPPSELTRQHLIAEYRELPRIFSLVNAAAVRGELPTDKRNPLQYTLGTGHVRFFYPRLQWVIERSIDLHFEMVQRGYNPSFEPRNRIAFEYIPDVWFGDWIPTADAMAINRARILERLSTI